VQGNQKHACINVKKGEWYMAKDSKHKKNMALFNARAPDTVLQQLNQSNRLEREKKKVQFATLFQILKDGRPMLEYESRAALYAGKIHGTSAATAMDESEQEKESSSRASDSSKMDSPQQTSDPPADDVSVFLGGLSFC
jgi:hypothetical protein